MHNDMSSDEKRNEMQRPRIVKRNEQKSHSTESSRSKAKKTSSGKKKKVYNGTFSGQFTESGLNYTLSGNAHGVLHHMVYKTIQKTNGDGMVCQVHPVAFKLEETPLTPYTYRQAIKELIDKGMIEAAEPSPRNKRYLPEKFRILFLKQLS